MFNTSFTSGLISDVLEICQLIKVFISVKYHLIKDWPIDLVLTNNVNLIIFTLPVILNNKDRCVSYGKLQYKRNPPSHLDFHPDQTYPICVCTIIDPYNHNFQESPDGRIVPVRQAHLTSAVSYTSPEVGQDSLSRSLADLEDCWVSIQRVGGDEQLNPQQREQLHRHYQEAARVMAKWLDDIELNLFSTGFDRDTEQQMKENEVCGMVYLLVANKLKENVQSETKGLSTLGSACLSGAGKIWFGAGKP